MKKKEIVRTIDFRELGRGKHETKPETLTIDAWSDPWEIKFPLTHFPTWKEQKSGYQIQITPEKGFWLWFEDKDGRPIDEPILITSENASDLNHYEGKYPRFRLKAKEAGQQATIIVWFS